MARAGHAHIKGPAVFLLFCALRLKRPRPDEQDVVVFRALGAMDGTQNDALAVAELPAAFGAGFIKEFQGAPNGKFRVVRFGPPGFQRVLEELNPLVAALFSEELCGDAAEVRGAHERGASLR